MASLAELNKKFSSRITIDANSKCWLWVGAYKTTCPVLNGKSARKLIYDDELGENLDDFPVNNTCQNFRCVNPDHLFIDGENGWLKRGAIKSGVISHLSNRGRRLCLNGHDLAVFGEYKKSTGGPVSPVATRCRECHRVARLKKLGRWPETEAEIKLRAREACKHGHDWSVYGHTGATGNRYCRECARLKSAARKAAAQ